MKNPLNESKINSAIEQYKKYIRDIIHLPILTYNEFYNLSQTSSKKSGIYLIFEDDELIYVGMTKNIKNRLKELLDFRRHSLARNLLSFELGEIIFETTGFTFLNEIIQRKLLDEGIISKEQFKVFIKAVKDKIKKFRFKFYESNDIKLENIEHFAIAVLQPIYNS